MNDPITVGPINRGILVFCGAVMLVSGLAVFQQAGATMHNQPRGAKAWGEVSGMILVAAVSCALAVVLVLLAAMVE